MSEENYRRIWLTKGQYAKVSPADFPALSQHKWHYTSSGYAARTMELPKTPEGKRRKVTVYMHRVIASCPEGLVVDHANRKRLDNRRKNLRITTEKHNAGNCEAFGASGYRGVDKRGKRFRCRFLDKYIGTFDTAAAAAEAYDLAALKEYGPFAFTNFDRDLYLPEEEPTPYDPPRAEAGGHLADVPF